MAFLFVMDHPRHLGATGQPRCGLSARPGANSRGPETLERYGGPPDTLSSQAQSSLNKNRCRVNFPSVALLVAKSTLMPILISRKAGQKHQDAQGARVGLMKRSCPDKSDSASIGPFLAITRVNRSIRRAAKQLESSDAIQMSG